MEPAVTSDNPDGLAVAEAMDAGGDDAISRAEAVVVGSPIRMATLLSRTSSNAIGTSRTTDLPRRLRRRGRPSASAEGPAATEVKGRR